jgi:hypothetical protein
MYLNLKQILTKMGSTTNPTFLPQIILPRPKILFLPKATILFLPLPHILNPT